MSLAHWVYVAALLSFFVSLTLAAFYSVNALFTMIKRFHTEKHAVFYYERLKQQVVKSEKEGIYARKRNIAICVAAISAGTMALLNYLNGN